MLLILFLLKKTDLKLNDCYDRFQVHKSFEKYIKPLRQEMKSKL